VGAAFAIFYTVAGMPIARWADRGNRRTIIVLALTAWSAMTVASGMARSFAQLLAARIGVGVGEAGCSPSAHSLISDYFPLERRGTALAIYQASGQIGIFTGLALGGYLAETYGLARGLLRGRGVGAAAGGDRAVRAARAAARSLRPGRAHRRRVARLSAAFHLGPEIATAGTSWKTFLKSHWGAIAATDFFSVEVLAWPI
jgi:MFS family permease